MQETAISQYIKSNGKRFDVHQFGGKWYILRTSLNFWRGRSNPSVTYTMMEPGTRTKLLDIVHYGAFAQVQKQIIGIDTQDKTRPNQFHWRGRSGLTWLLASDWTVLDHDPACQAWAVTYFSRTLFTSAGIDIYARQPYLSADKLTEIEERLQRNEFFAPYARALFAPGRE